MNILVLGGTVFLGRHIVEAAQARGHEITLFNRGEHNPELFPEVEKLRGDRKVDLGALRGRRWDAAIDTCGYVPRVVRASAELLADALEHYTFVSSLSVYGTYPTHDMDETAPVARLEDESVEEVTGETYGPLKALCEEAAEQAMPGRVANIRPGLIVGEHDPTDRFTYWPHRVARGGEMIAPGRPDASVQLIDVRDLADWIVRMAENRTTGVFNATGPAERLTFGELLEESLRVTGSNADFVWVDLDFLMERGVAPWSDLPLILPDSDEYRGFSTIDCSRAKASGLRFLPLADTIRDTLTWAATRPTDYELRAGLKEDWEHELLETWKSTRK